MTVDQQKIETRVKAQIQREDGRRAERQRGLAYARAWRERNKPIFDALYGAETCACGSAAT